MKTCKKLLAIALVAAVLLTTLVSGLVVSAADANTLVIGTTEIVKGTATADVEFTLTYAEATKAPHSLCTITADEGLTLTALTLGAVDYVKVGDTVVDDELVADAAKITIDDNGKNIAAGKVLFESAVDSNAPTVKSIKFVATFAVADPDAIAEYNVTAAIDATNYDEADVAIDVTAGKVSVVEPPHVCDGTILENNGDGTHAVKCECGKVVTAAVACTYVGGFCACGAEEPVTGPVLDETITLTAGLNVTETVNTRVIISKEVAAYADYDLVLSRKKAYINSSNGNAYDLTDVQEFVYDKGEEVTVMSDGRGAFLYNELGMYELGIDFTIMIKCYDAEGNYVAYSNSITTNVGELAYDLYDGGTAKQKAVTIDIARLGDQAQAYMVSGKDCGLATITSPITYFPEDATEGSVFDAASLNKTNVSESAVSGVTITPSVNVSGNPCIRYIIGGTGTTYAQDTLKLVINYTNGKSGADKSVIVSGADLQVVGTAGSASVRYANLFSAVALYDGNVTITATLYSGDTVLASNQYSVESYVSQNYSHAKMGSVLQAVANVGASARYYFGM